MSQLEKIKAFLGENGLEYYIANIDEGKIVTDDRYLPVMQSKVVTINILIGEDSEENTLSSSSCNCSNVTSIS